MADFQGINTPNIAAGWGAMPKLDAPSIGGLVSAILENRYRNQALTQKSVSDAIKEYQDRQQASAFGSALQNSGIVPQGVDVSGMSSADLARLSQQIQEQTPDTESDTLKKAMANYYDKLATTGGTRGGPAGPRPFTQGQQFNALKTQAGLLGSQADELESQQEDYGLPAQVGPATHGYVMRNGKLDYARTPEEQAKPDLVSPGDPITDPNAKTFTPEVYAQRQAQSDARKQILTEQKRVQQQILAPQGIRQNDVDQANQAQQPQVPYDQSIPGVTPGSSAPPPAASGANSVLILRAQAQDAIARGADPVAVKQRFRDQTGGEL